MKSKLIVPESLNEITLGQYQKFVKLITDNPDSEFTRQKSISILCNVEMDFVRSMQMHSIDEVYTHLIGLFEVKQPLIATFKINNKEFGLIPNFDKMSGGEFADLDEYFGTIELWDRMMAVLYRPITKKIKHLYDIEKYKGTQDWSEVMKDTPVSIVLGAQVFFSDLERELLSVTMDYLEELPPQTKAIIQEKANLEKNGDGIIAFMRSPKETLSRLMTQLN